jgi:hypothetical protein
MCWRCLEIGMLRRAILRLKWLIEEIWGLRKWLNLERCMRRVVRIVMMLWTWNLYRGKKLINLVLQVRPKRKEYWLMQLKTQETLTTWQRIQGILTIWQKNRGTLITGLVWTTRRSNLIFRMIVNNPVGGKVIKRHEYKFSFVILNYQFILPFLWCKDDCLLCLCKGAVSSSSLKMIDETS